MRTSNLYRHSIGIRLQTRQISNSLRLKTLKRKDLGTLTVNLHHDWMGRKANRKFYNLPFSKMYDTLMKYWGSIRALCKTGIVSGFICFLRRRAIGRSKLGRSKLGRNGMRQGTSAPLALPDPDSPIKLTVFWHEIGSVLRLPKSGRCGKKEVDWFLCVLCWNAGGGPGSRSVRGWRIAHVVRFVRFVCNVLGKGATMPRSVF